MNGDDRWSFKKWLSASHSIEYNKWYYSMELNDHCGHAECENLFLQNPLIFVSNIPLIIIMYFANDKRVFDSHFFFWRNVIFLSIRQHDYSRTLRHRAGFSACLICVFERDIFIRWKFSLFKYRRIFCVVCFWSWFPNSTSVMMCRLKEARERKKNPKRKIRSLLECIDEEMNDHTKIVY